MGFVPAFLIIIASFFAVSAPAAHAAEPLPQIVIATPGPRSLTFLPFDLIPKIGADRAEGAEVKLLFVNGGSIALKQLTSRNADFAAAAVPAAMSARQSGAHISVVAAADDTPLFVLMVRSELRDKVRTIADLRDRMIGVNTSSLTSKTGSQQLAELLLKTAGVPLADVRIMAVGKNWESQAAAINSATVDAIMGDEPYASRLRDEGKVFFLFNLSNPEDAKKVPGSNFLHASLETRDDMIKTDPDKVAKTVRMVKRSLEWIAQHTPEEIVDVLGVTDEQEKQSLIGTLRTYRTIFSRTGALVPAQMHDSAVFFASSSGIPLEESKALLDGMVVDTWVKEK